MVDLNLEKFVVELSEFIRSRCFGKYRGLVTDNKDPESLGRIQALVPGVLGDSVVSSWALPCTPYAGDRESQFMIPPIGASVWIEFEGGDVSFPIWSGCWWSKDNLPREADDQADTPVLKIIRSESGLMVTLDDKSQTVSVSDDNGRNILNIQVMKEKITIKCATKVVVEAPQIELVENATHPS